MQIQKCLIVKIRMSSFTITLCNLMMSFPFHLHVPQHLNPNVNTAHVLHSVICKPPWTCAVQDVVWKTDDGAFTLRDCAWYEAQEHHKCCCPSSPGNTDFGSRLLSRYSQTQIYLDPLTVSERVSCELSIVWIYMCERDRKILARSEDRGTDLTSIKRFNCWVLPFKFVS